MEEYGQYETCFQGDSWIRSVHVTDSTDADFDLSHCTIDFTMYLDSSVVMTKGIGTGITVTDPTGGVFYITLDPSDTTALLGSYIWEVKITTATSELYTVATGILTVFISRTYSSVLAFINSSSPYEVLDEDDSDFSLSEFDSLYVKADDILQGDDPGLNEVSYDHCLALMVLHLHEMKLGNTGMVSENLGGYSYNRGTPNMTGWLVQYNDIISKAWIWYGTSPEELDGKRADRTMNNMKLDQAEPDYYDGED